MGKVILVPPPMTVNTVVNENGAFFSGLTNSLPVEFVGSGGGVLMASVNVKEPHGQTEYYDPMHSYIQFHSMSGAMGRSNVSRRLNNSSPMIRRVETESIPLMFWDHHELEQIVENYHGHLLVQIDPRINISAYYAPTSWNFSVTDMRDSPALTELLSRRKKNLLRSHRGFRTEVAEWLRRNATEYDLFEAKFNGLWDDVFIRDDAEAIHFKMKWQHEEPAPEAT